jgi:glycosyltransferase involved in cell wall biosynthesis
MRLSLVIPCYNEAANLPLLVERCAALTAGGDIEVVLVDNGSTDHTPSVLPALLALAPGCRAVRIDKNQGYGFGILTGLRQARAEVIGWTHADMQTDPLDAARGLSLFKEAADPQQLFVKGRRYGRPLGDRLFTTGMSLFETALLGTVLWDINAQPTIFTRSFFDIWRDPPHDFSLDLFAYHQAKRCGLQIRRIPVRFNKRAHGVSHWNVDWPAKWKFIRRTVDFSLQLRKRVNR